MLKKNKISFAYSGFKKYNYHRFPLMKISDSLQKILPFGYLFLVVMGILKESVYYYQLGINYLKYATIMDVLISPIATLTLHPLLPVTLGVVIAVSYGISVYYVRQKAKAGKGEQVMSKEESAAQLSSIFVRCFAFTLLCFFLGIGVGEGLGTQRKIATNSLHYDYKLNYNSVEAEEVCILGSNSVYYFYLSRGNKSIRIMPVGGIKNLEMIHNRMLP